MTRGSALRRPGYGGFRRNVAVAIGNAGRVEDVGALAEALDDADALVRGHAAWALGRIGGMEARRALHTRLAAEPDPDVRQELEAALAAAASPDASSSRSAGSDRSITP